MDTNKMRPITAATNFAATGWKSAECRRIMVNKIADFVLKNGPPSWKQNLPLLLGSVETFEEKVFASSKVEAEYIAKISEKLKSIAPSRQSAENLLPQNSSISREEEIKAIREWQEQVYQKVQMIKATYYTKLDTFHKLISRKLQQLKNEPAPLHPKTITDMEGCEQHKRALEYTFLLLNVDKSKIDRGFKQRLDRLEKYIQDVLQKKYFSYCQQQCSFDVQSKQQVEPSNSISSQLELAGKKPASQVISLPSSHLTKQIPYLTLQEVNQFCSSRQGNQLSMEKGCGNHAVEPQIGVEIEPSEAFVNEPADIPDDTSPAMKHFIKFRSMSAEAFIAATDDIGLALHLNDDIPEISTDENANLNCYDPVPTGKKIKRFFNSTPASGSSGQFISAEKPASISKEIYTILEEIKVINNLLIDTQVVISEGNTITGVAEGAPEHDEGLFVKLVFNSVTINLPPTAEQATNKESIIKPLHLFVPGCYPLRSPVISDETPSEIRVDVDVDDLSSKANLKLRLSLRSMNEPLSLQNIAVSWDQCVREAICEYAQKHGGGTFSSKYGGWELCSNGF
ncbi:mediator of RNA polymerase II transcription subunit 15a-like isoform X2 [Arachis duranensis]|uniref:Mediator of RNA polymerase II transcription subunit 15a-like isoform X2 n=1 Tax=Arachis duranensis TaxID=130453 RepID=A0A9C6WRK8_ARADU|nr:mediator of RNA polymerase II transcription subunit 15a-like isoform X2 [Arachis duranensis]